MQTSPYKHAQNLPLNLTYSALAWLITGEWGGGGGGGGTLTQIVFHAH